jgi:hypothetical protein
MHEDEEACDCDCQEQETETSPHNSWGAAFEEAYFQLQVEAMKAKIARKYGKAIDRGAEIMVEHFISELRNTMEREKARDDAFDALTKAMK